MPGLDAHFPIIRTGYAVTVRDVIRVTAAVVGGTEESVSDYGSLASSIAAFVTALHGCPKSDIMRVFGWDENECWARHCYVDARINDEGPTDVECVANDVHLAVVRLKAWRKRGRWMRAWRAKVEQPPIVRSTGTRRALFPAG